MNINKWLRLTGLCLTLLLAGSVFSQGLYWESTTSGGPMGDKENVSQNYAIQKMFKLVNPLMTMIFRMDKEAIYTINPEEKTYTEMTFAQMESMAKKAGGFDVIRKDWIEFSKRMASLSNTTGMSEAYSKIDGFPMETDMLLGSTKMVTVVTKIEKRSPSAREFEVPAGYTKTQSPLGDSAGK
jgi:hypothetical protein